MKCGNLVCFGLGENIKSYFDVSNLGGELEFTFFIYWFILFIYLSFDTRVDVFFWVFQERQVHSDQDLVPPLATFRLGVLDWDF